MVKNSNIDLTLYKFNLALFLRAVLLLSPVIFLFYLDNNLTIKDFFIFQGVFYLASIIFEVPVGYFADIFSKKKMLLFSLIIFLFITIFWIFFHGFYVILFGEILFALSKVAMDNAMPCYLYEYLDANHKENQMVKHYGYLNFNLAFGTAIAGIIGVFIFKNYGFTNVLISELILIVISILLILSLPRFETIKKESFSQFYKIKSFLNTTKNIIKNPDIKYHIAMSGLLTACSILFVTSFQPIMQKSLFPIFIFGIVTFSNHFIRAISSLFANKFKIEYLGKLCGFLYILYILDFIFILLMLKTNNIIFILSLILFICLTIGLQLIFFILHVSRLQKIAPDNKKGNFIFVNNIFSRGLVAIILILSRIFINKSELTPFYIIIFILFLIFGTYLTRKLLQVKE